MMQRQIMFKQLQELQRRQELQDLGGGRHQDYASLKQASAVQFVPTTPLVYDSQMLMIDDMQMIQQGESSIFQGFPSGLVLSQSYSNSLGSADLSTPQFSLSLYDPPVPNTNKNANVYYHLQDPYNDSVNLLTKNTDSLLGLSSMHPSTLTSSFISQQGNFSSDQSMPHGSLLTNQVFQEKNLYGEIPFQSSSSNHLPLNYSQQGITTQRNRSAAKPEGRHEDTGWPGISPGKVPKIGVSQADASLDPLEQKILYGTDEPSWGLSFGTSGKMGTGDFECTVENPSFMDGLASIQSGSWSALMQSAVAETSSSDTVVQEEWGGLSFQNPESSSDNQPSNFVNIEKLQNNWVNRSFQNVSSPSSEPELSFKKSIMKCSFPGYQQSGNQFLLPKDEFQSEASHASVQHSPSTISHLADYDSQLEQPTSESQLVQTSLPSENTLPSQHKENLKSGTNQPKVLSSRNEGKPCINFSGHDLEDISLLHGSSSNYVSGGFQTPIDQLSQLNIHRYSVESQKMDSVENVESISAHSGASSDLHGQHEITQSHVESQAFGFGLGPLDSGTPKSYSYFPSLSMGSSSVISLPSNDKEDYFKNQHPAPSVSSHTTSKLPAYSVASSQVNFQLKTADSHGAGPEFPLLENVAVTQPSGASIVSQRVGFPTEFPTSWPGITTQQDVLSPKTKFSSSLIQSSGSASSSLKTSSGAPYEHPSRNCFKHVNNVGYHDQPLEKVSFIHEGSTEIQNPMPLSRNTDAHKSLGKYYSEVDVVASASLLTHTSQQPSEQADQKNDETPVVPACDTRAFGHSLHQNYSLLHQSHYPRDAQTNCSKRFPFKHENIDYQQPITKAKELLLNGQKFEVKDKAKSDQEAVQVGVFSPDDNKGWTFSQEAQEDKSGKASSAAYLQNFQQMEMLGQNDSQNHSIGSNEASNAANQSQISLQMAPSWSEHCESLKNGHLLLMYNPKDATIGAQTFSGLRTGNLQENSMLPSDGTNQNLAAPKQKKRKIVVFDMVPWHKEVKCEALRPQNISVAELEWAQASNRRQEEVTSEAEIVDDVLPVVRAKRRLLFTTQLMQQVFRPASAGILFADASSNCEYLAYSAARLSLVDACNLNAKRTPDSNDVLSDKLKTSKRTSACDFSKVVECLISRVNKLEGDLSRLDRNLSIVDIKVENQELEKFSTLNRFAKFHMKVHPMTVDPALTAGPSNMQKTTPQQYGKAVPMPRIFPDGIDCLPL